MNLLLIATLVGSVILLLNSATVVLVGPEESSVGVLYGSARCRRGGSLLLDLLLLIGNPKEFSVVAVCKESLQCLDIGGRVIKISTWGSHHIMEQ